MATKLAEGLGFAGQLRKKVKRGQESPNEFAYLARGTAAALSPNMQSTTHNQAIQGARILAELAAKRGEFRLYCYYIAWAYATFEKGG